MVTAPMRASITPRRLGDGAEPVDASTTAGVAVSWSIVGARSNVGLGSAADPTVIRGEDAMKDAGPNGAIGRHIDRRVHRRMGRREGDVFGAKLRDSEVENFDDPPLLFIGKEEVRRFQVAMDDPRRVGLLHRLAGLHDDADRLLDRKLPAAPELHGELR
jgi:hypothetical protein